MFDLYFSSVTHIISTCLIVCAAAIIIYVLRNLKDYNYWGRTFIILFFLGLLMSMMSGTRDAIGTEGGFPTQGTLFIVLCGLGVLGFIIGVAALISNIFHTNVIFHYGSFILMLIVIIKTVLVEGQRIMTLFT